MNSVVSQKDQAQRGRELLASIGSGADDNVHPKTQCNEYLLQKTTRSRNGSGFKGADGSHIKRQWCFGKSQMCASRPRNTTLYLTRILESNTRTAMSSLLRGAVCLVCGCGSRRVPKEG